MTEETNPNDASQISARRLRNQAFVTKGRVSTADKDQGGRQHNVEVQQSGQTISNEVPVLTRVHGDMYIPPQGSPVAMAPDDNGEYMVIGVPLPDTDSNTSVNPGERIISHPLSKTHLRWNEDGSFKLRAECNVDEPEVDRTYPEIKFERDGTVKIIGDSETDNNTHEIIYQPNGTVDVSGAPKVRINGGGVAAVTDVTIATKDSDGAATSLDIHRNDTVLLPSGNTTTTSS